MKHIGVFCLLILDYLLAPILCLPWPFGTNENLLISDELEKTPILMKREILNSSYRVQTLFTSYNQHQNQLYSLSQTANIVGPASKTQTNTFKLLPLKPYLYYTGADDYPKRMVPKLPTSLIHDVSYDGRDSETSYNSGKSESLSHQKNYGKPFSVILVASGIGQRMNSNIPKQFLSILGKPVISYSINLFLSYPNIEFLIIVADMKYFPHIKNLIGNDPRCILVQGGHERSDSVYNGLKCLEKYLRNRETTSSFKSTNKMSMMDTTDAQVEDKIKLDMKNNSTRSSSNIKSRIHKVTTETPKENKSYTQLNNTYILPKYVVAIHDAARPCLTAMQLNKVLEEGEYYGAATLSVPVLPTIKICKRNTKFVDETLDRDLLYDIQTPQAFHFDILIEAYKYAKKNQIKLTDDASAMEAFSHPVKLTEGDVNNIKLTHPRDLHMAHIILSNIPTNS